MCQGKKKSGCLGEVGFKQKSTQKAIKGDIFFNFKVGPKKPDISVEL